MKVSRSVVVAAVVAAGVSALGTPVSAAERASDNLSALQSARTDSSSLDGQVVYVDFWASWCPPCRQSFPWMARQSEDYVNRGLRVVAVNVDKKHQDAVRFLEKADPHFEIVFDSTGSLAESYHLEAMPTSFVYGRDGRLRYSHQGFAPEDEPVLDSVIRALLEEKPTE